ncbi:VWA domain-containing protein [Actinokineospora sp. NBRC 105648]|uniref:VWA domain-containing protein n=1 Tax=Actinokineospora sp. NBRC 105648 TaxID=3032206 RepID=UPI0025522C35|nr:VWA domain-containing protein [Actinokineospora sp. NBRC 105648]
MADSATKTTAIGQTPDIELRPAQIVILVDESGSISAADMVREQDAASLIAQGEFSPRSTVSVVGFASDSGSRSPVDVVCPPLVVAGAAERDQLAQCVRGLRKRTTGEGASTDHAEALRQALSYLGTGTPEEGPKLVFLLTDGVLDVGDSPRYGVGKTATQRNDAAREVIRQTLVTARDKGVQVWPLGFGNVDRAALEAFAAGGYQGSCGPTVPKPSATVVSSSNDVAAALLRSFSAARCAGLGPIDSSELGSGRVIEVPVTIPAIATDGTITVVKHDGRIRVDYTDPGGRMAPKAGTTESGEFQVSGDNGAVEVLRIGNPVPGVWKVRVTSPADVPAQNVLTAVTWLGAAQTSILVDPPSPAQGQQVTLSVQVILRGGKPVATPELLRDLTFTAEMSGGSVPTQPVPLRDDGQAPDSAADGTYTGQLTIPAGVRDEVTFRGRVTGLGISAADAVATARVSPGVPTLLVTTSLPVVTDPIAPGESRGAKVSVSNTSGKRARVRVQVRADGPAQVTVPADQAVREVDPGSSTFTFPMVFGADTPVGTSTGVVRVVDDTDPGIVLHEKRYTVQVALPPEPFPLLRLISLTALGIAVLIAVLWLIARRRAQEVQALRVQAVREGRRAYLPTEARRSKQFQFTVDTQGPVPRLDVAAPGEPTAYTLTRSRAGLRLRTPYGSVLAMQIDQEVEVGEGLTIVVTVDPEYALAGAFGVNGAQPARSGWDTGDQPTEHQPIPRDPYL